jgi:hypothetical protein
MELARTLAVSALLVAVPVAGVAAAESAETVAIDIAKTRAPISKYVYGQFIEHLGRSIYGGLWAEMLEDRKFLYPVDGTAPAWEMFQPGKTSWEGEGHPYELLVRSPWMILGERQAVTMSRDRPFVGEHTPVVTADAKGAGLMPYASASSPAVVRATVTRSPSIGSAKTSRRCRLRSPRRARPTTAAWRSSGTGPVPSASVPSR